MVTWTLKHEKQNPKLNIENNNNKVKNKEGEKMMKSNTIYTEQPTREQGKIIKRRLKERNKDKKKDERATIISCLFDQNSLHVVF